MIPSGGILNMPKVKKGTGWPRLEIYLPDEELRRRVKLAAATHDVKLSEYCVIAILERLEQDEAQGWNNQQVQELYAWQKQVKAGLGRRKIPDSARILRQLRKERARALAGLR
jgi:hypothetical protein